MSENNDNNDKPLFQPRTEPLTEDEFNEIKARLDKAIEEIDKRKRVDWNYLSQIYITI